jgi:hypothetical protein
MLVDRGHIIASTAISDVWAEARTLALTPAQFASPLAGRDRSRWHLAAWAESNQGRQSTPELVFVLVAGAGFEPA